MRAKREILFNTEVELCAAFLDWLKQYPEWTAYAETEGWDILLAHADGTQIGIQAKLKFNMEVLCQAIEAGGNHEHTGPDYRAILVPGDAGVEALTAALGITLIRVRKGYRTTYAVTPELSERSWETWHFNNPEKRHQLPSYVPDVPAGDSAPCALTKWKIGALEISAVLEIRGYVTRHDFKLAGIDHRRWKDSWLEPVPGALGQWRWRDGKAGVFAKQHPVVYPQVLAKVRERLVI